MVERLTKEKIYDYDLNANKVLNTQNKDYSQRDNEPSGEPETLVGKKLAPFGDLAIREKPPSVLSSQTKHTKRLIDRVRKKNTSIPLSSNNPTYNSAIPSINSEHLLYQPKTHETKLTYEELLNIVQKYLIDQPPQYITSALDVIIASIRNEDIDMKTKQNDIEQVLISKISEEELNKVYQLCKSLFDFEVKERDSNFNVEHKEIEMNFQLEETENDVDSDNENEYANEVNEYDKEEDDDVDMQVEGNKIKGNVENEISDAIGNNDESEMLSVNAVLMNKFWLQMYIKEVLKVDDSLVLAMESDIMDLLKLSDLRECENKMVGMLKRENFDFIKFMLVNKELIYYSTKLAKCQNEKEREYIIKEMCNNENGLRLYEKIMNYSKIKKKTSSLLLDTNEQQHNTSINKEHIDDIIKTNYNLDELTFTNGAHFNSNNKLILPSGTFKQTFPGYEEIHIPPSNTNNSNSNTQQQHHKEIKISSMLPTWMHRAFQYIHEDDNGNTSLQFINQTLNKIQIKVKDCALNSDINMLICAPTSSGKTNIAMLTILRLISKYRNATSNVVNTNQFKIVYIAPMKALVKETVGNFSQRLSDYGINVKELSGDINLSKHELEETTVIVTTPEKWDIITRKAGEKTFTDKVQLLIVDEIHLLHDTRGSVLESIIARTIKQRLQVRIVALSATLPNYKDVAEFCKVPKQGVFYFDNTYRPIPLEQLYIGITETKGIKKLLLINEITYNKVIERLNQGKQILVFVHSRKETLRTANMLIETAMNRKESNKFILSEIKHKEFNEILNSDVQNNILKDKSLLNLFKHGIGIHHAGMHRDDKELVEEYFNNNYLNIIISTATLAWGVNLPAHTVIIKGTQVYEPDKGAWCELSHLDIMQMMGRAGRVGYGSSIGEGIIITSYNELQYYLSLLNMQLPIESQLIPALPDTLNAEIVSGNISNIKDAVDWMGFTYLYIRMLKKPEVYGISKDMFDKDKHLIKRRSDLIHSCALLLDKNGLIKYNVKLGEFTSTQLGKVASYYYIKHQSIGIYNQHLNPNMNIIDLFRLFSLSNEFKLIPIRQEEKKEIEKLLQKVPIPVKGSNDEPSSKINILLQAYISNISLDSYAISSDMIYVSQNASRIFKALYEICIKRAWASLSVICLNVLKMIRLRMWSTLSPLRQFGIIPKDILHKIESKEQLTWNRLCELNANQIGEILKINKKNSEGIFKLVHTFPNIDLTANIQPLTRNCLLIELIVTPKFKWNSNYHKHSELFHIFVEDNDSEVILHYETFILKQSDFITESTSSNDVTAPNEKHISFIVPLIEPTPPQYFIRVISDNWLTCEKLLAIYFKQLVLPEKFPPYTNLLDLHLLTYSSLFKHKRIEAYYASKYTTMNAIQTQCFKSIYESNCNIFIGATPGNGKTQLAEFAIIKQLLSPKAKAPIIYICANDINVNIIYEHFNTMFMSCFNNNISINVFHGEYTLDSKLFDKSDIVVTSTCNWEVFMRRIKRKKTFNDIPLIIIDDIHLITKNNCALEMALTKVKYNKTLMNNTRVIVLSTSLSNPNSICEWFDIDMTHNCFNFNPNVRQNKIEIFFYGYDAISNTTRFNLMIKPIIQQINKHCYVNVNESERERERVVKLSTMVYVSDVKRAKIFALQMLASFNNDGFVRKCLINNNVIDNYIDDVNCNLDINNNDKVLITSLLNGIGIIHEGISMKELQYMLHLYNERIIQMLIITYNMIHHINTFCHVVIIADPIKYETSNYGWNCYDITDMQEIIGKASITYVNSSSSSDNDIPEHVKAMSRKCFIFFNNSKKEFFKKFLLEGYPLESGLNQCLHNYLNSEIANGVIKNKQNCVDWLTWTFYYQRLLKNPNYYNMKSNTNETDINQYLSELIEIILTDLHQAQCIIVNANTNEISSTNLGKIASFYNVSYTTIDAFNQSCQMILTQSNNTNSNNSVALKLSEIFTILKTAYEYEDINYNKDDIDILYDIAHSLPQAYLSSDIINALKHSNNDKSTISYVFSDPHNKALILLLCYLSRIHLPFIMKNTVDKVITTTSKLILSLVDILSSLQNLNSTLLTIELSQMLVQGMWITQSPLLQLPTFTYEKAQMFKNKHIDDVFALINMENEDERKMMLNVNESELKNIADVCNRYPDISMNATVCNTNMKTTNVFQGKENIVVVVELNREWEDNELSCVYSECYPCDKEEAWWVIVGCIKDNILISIKRVNFVKGIKIPIEFPAPEEEGHYEYKLYLLCDSWIGCDQDEDFSFEVVNMQ